MQLPKWLSSGFKEMQEAVCLVPMIHKGLHQAEMFVRPVIISETRWARACRYAATKK